MPHLLTIRFTLLAATAWTAAIGASLAWNLDKAQQQALDSAYAEARANLNKDIAFRRWATGHGGVYVPLTETQQPEPWMSHVPGRDVVTRDGVKLTLLNPATMLRQMMDRYAGQYGIQGRITGLKTLNPGNAPDPWEREQLLAFTRGEGEEVWAIAAMKGQPYLRYLRAMVMEPGCDKCHAVLGYKTGDVRGATGLNLPLTPYYRQLDLTRANLSLSHGAIWLLGLTGIGWSGWLARLRERERLRAEAALRLAETRYRTIFEQARDGIVIVDPFTRRFTEFNAVAHEQLGYGAGEFAALTISDIEAEESTEETARHVEAIKERGWDKFETRHRRKDGILRDIQVMAQTLVIDGKPALHCSFRDITERKQAETALRLGSARLNEAQRIAKVGSWTLDLRANRLEWSDEIYRIFEIDPARFGASYEAFLNAIHPEDREKVNRAYGESLASRVPYRINHRLLFPDGRIKYVEERGETLYDENGAPILSRGTVQDITALQRAEEALRLYANAFRHSGEAIMISDRDNRIIALNPAFTRLTGYTLEDVRGMNPRVLASGRTPPETYQTMWSALNESGFWQGELWDRRKNGSLYPKWAAISVIHDAAGNITHYIGSFTDISERKAAEERIHRLAHHDALTGLLNRFSLENRLVQALLSARRENEELAVMFIDLDRFKTINDTLGHHVGDTLLIEVGRRLHTCVRESDIVARLGGDEFVVAVTGMEAEMAAAHIADKIVAALCRPYLIAGNELHTSPSLGISIFPSDGEDAETLMKNADTAMYHAKELGRNNYQFFTSAMNAAAGERLRLEHDLRAALADGQFELHYQPQICASDNRVCGVEALVRWRHPQRGLIPPLKFIPIAEENGMIEALGEWVLDEACRQLAAWREQGLNTLRMAVNLSAHQLRSPTLVERVRTIMAKHGLGSGELELEVTESAAMADPERAIGQLKALRELGVGLAIDDFGTGYSSLAYLKLLPIQILKLDRAFVSDIESNENGAAISAATLALAHNLGLKVVAEGVETEEQRAFLAAHQCDFLQGYLFSKPLAADAATEFLRNAPHPPDKG